MISAAVFELRRLGALLRALADGHARLEEVDLRDESYMDDLAQDTEALQAAIDQMRGSRSRSRWVRSLSSP